MSIVPTLDGFIAFIRNQMGISAQYLPDSSDDISTAYNLSLAQVNVFFARITGSLYQLMVYNLAADILINIAQDYRVGISHIYWTAGVATVITSTPNTFVTGNVVSIVGAVPVGYNVSAMATISNPTYLTLPIPTNPNAYILGGTIGFNLFETLRSNWHLNNFVGGVIQESHDETTGETIAVPDAIKQATLNDLQLFKTPYGRFYLQYAQKLGTAWGIS